MLLWICLASLAAAVVAALLHPLRRVNRPAAIDPGAADLAVYRDQLEALEAEKESGLVSESEIASARAEVARRLLKRAEATPGTPLKPEHTPGLARKVYLAVAGLVPVLSILIYLAAGTPDLPSRPFAERKAEPVQEASIADIIGRIEERLRTHPNDGQGWDVLAPVYLRLGRFGDAAHAYAEANRLLGETAKRLLGFAEATLLAENGIVTEPVRKAAQRVSEIAPDRIEPKVWLALGKEQDGDLAGAAADYRALIEGAPKEAPWRDAVSRRLDRVEKQRAGLPVEDEPVVPKQQAAPPAVAGPSPADQERVNAMKPEERAAFIQQMVDGLATRLKENGKDLAGWLKLARAYKVMGRDGDARAVLDEARRNFSGDAASEGEIEAAAKGLGLAP